jgi:uncharacterized protein YaiI (UPF0178 family)
VTRADDLAIAADYLIQAVNALARAARVLNSTGALGAADQIQGMHDLAKPLQEDIRRAARAAHRVERPEFYDARGRWVGRPYGNGGRG